MRGFFFAVMALAMLSLVLMTVQVWVKTFEQSDYRASQRFKGEAVRSILDSLSDKTLTGFANASAFYATYKLVNYTSNQGLGLGQAIGSDETRNKGTGLVESAAIGLMMNGSSPPGWGVPIEYSADEKNAYTLAGWQNRTDAAANAMGFGIQFSDARNFRYYQVDAWTVGVSFDMDMNITDMEGTMRQNKTMHAESNFSVSGFLDPMITRKDMERAGSRDLATEKQIFRHDGYSTPDDVKPEIMDAYSVEGNGWFFGPIVEQYPYELGNSTGANIGNLKQYVLVHAYDANLSSYADAYGAVIVTGGASSITVGCAERQTRCLNCMERQMGGPGCPPATTWYTYPNNNPADVPVIVPSNAWDINNVMNVTKAETGGSLTEKFVLIDNEKESSSDKMSGYHRIWDITKLRDMAICGFYVGGKGPSFFQRMLSGAESIQNLDFGIESFVVGQWAGGAIDQSRDGYSRLDWEFYGASHVNDARIKGMMGCKSKEMCSVSNSNATKIGVGKFRLSTDSAARYGSSSISCAATPSSPCD